MSTDDRRIQSVRNAWINTLRAETLRAHSPEVSRVAQIGSWIATYADADGSNAFPSRETLATLAGGTAETVTRAVKVLVAVGMLTVKRRPNQPSMYQLLVPVERPNWAAHIHLYSETRQKRDRAVRKLRAVEALESSRTASPDVIRTASQDGYPDSVAAGGSGQRPATPSRVPDSVPGRPRTASEDAIRTASQVGGYQYHLPTVGTHSPHQDAADVEPQPQVRAPDANDDPHPGPATNAHRIGQIREQMRQQRSA